jgi:ATP synthase protein I
MSVANQLAHYPGRLTGTGRAQYGPPGFQDDATTHRLACAGVEDMSDNPREGDRESKLAEEAALSARLRRLGDRLAKPVGSRQDASPSRSAADMSAFARGMRLSAELVGGVVVGFLLGWLFDRWLGTSPWGLIVFLLLGFVAGVLNVMRSAGVIPSRSGTNN